MTPKEVCGADPAARGDDRRPPLYGFPGVWQHFSIPADSSPRKRSRTESASTVRAWWGWRAINEADLLVVPQPETVLIDPFDRAADPDDGLQHPGSDHPAGLHERPATSPAKRSAT